MMYLCNAFSFNMINMTALAQGGSAKFDVVSPEYVAERADCWESACGHSTELISSYLGMDVPKNRVSIKLSKGDQVFVAQYSGPRLSEGATELPEGASLVFLLVTIE